MTQSVHLFLVKSIHCYATLNPIFRAYFIVFYYFMDRNSSIVSFEFSNIIHSSTSKSTCLAPEREIKWFIFPIKNLLLV